MSENKDGISTYLDYIDKEMTIMGILSSFCIISLGFATDKLVLPDKECQRVIWDITPLYVFIALIGLLLSALSFYRQRALLAWYYGQISLSNAKNEDQKIQTLLDDSDNWDNWVYYQIGFGFLFLAISELGCALLSSKLNYLTKYQFLFGITFVIIWFLIYFLKVRSYKKYKYSQSPEKDLWLSIFKTEEMDQLTQINKTTF